MEKNQFTLSLSGVSSDQCVIRINSALIRKDLDATLIINETRDLANISTRLTEQEAISAIIDIGYQASIFTIPRYEVAANKISCQSVHLALIGITCVTELNCIENALKKLDQVGSVNINFASRTAIIHSNHSAQSLINAIENAGFNASEIVDERTVNDEKNAQEATKYQEKIKQSIWGFSLGIPLTVHAIFTEVITINTLLQQFIWLVIGLATLVVLHKTAKAVFISAWRAFLNHHANKDSLIALAVGALWLYSILVVLISQWLPEGDKQLYFDASTMIIALINLAQAFEIKAQTQMSHRIKRLLELGAKTEVTIGDKIRVLAGERIPADGVIVEGVTFIDESMLTGELVPVEKHEKDLVYAGTINGQASIVIEVVKDKANTMLSKIINKVINAQHSKPSICLLVDKIAEFFVPAVMLLAIFTALLWYNFAPSAFYILISVTSVLIIACPCALALATPVSTMMGVAKASEFGGLINNANTLQRASEIDLIVLDEISTITKGKPKVTHYYSISTDQSILHLVEAIQKEANNSTAQALINFTQKHKTENLNDFSITQFKSITAMGVQALWNGKTLLLGNEKLMHKFDLQTDTFSDVTQQWQQNSDSVVYFAIGNEIKALFAIKDPIKEDTKRAIERFHQHNIHVVMLTSDNKNTAKSVANAVNITEFHADLTSNEKLAWIEKWQSEGRVIGMVHASVNDTSALTKSDVSFTMFSDHDACIDSTNITLMRSSLHAVIDMIAICNATMKNIKQNLWGVFLYHSLAILLATGLLFPLTGWLLSPIIAGAFMSLCALAVVKNANRLQQYTPS